MIKERIHSVEKKKKQISRTKTVTNFTSFFDKEHYHIPDIDIPSSIDLDEEQEESEEEEDDDEELARMESIKLNQNDLSSIISDLSDDKSSS